MFPKRIPWMIPLFFAPLCVGPALGGAIDFTGLDGTAVSSGGGQTFPWTLGPTGGTVTLSADWSNLSDQGGPMRTSTNGPASLANPFVGTLTLSFSEPVQVSLLATAASLLTDGLDGGRIERVTLSTAGGVVFLPQPGTSAIYSGAGSHTITADDEYSPTPTTSDWGFVGSGQADTYTFVYESSRVGFSETFDVIVTPVPEPSSWALLLGGLMGVGAVGLRGRNRRNRRTAGKNPGT